MTTTQLEASHNLIVNEIVATKDRATNTEEEGALLYRRKLQKVLGINFIAAATRKDENLRPRVNFVRKRDWDALKLSFGGYCYNIRNRLHVKDDCLLIDDRIVLPTQLRQTVLDSLHLTHPGSAVMLDLCQNICFPHIHKTIVQMAQRSQECTQQGKI